MRHTASAVLAAAVLAVGFSAPASAEDTEHVSKTLHLDPGGTLRVRNFSGRVTIAASDASEVSIDAVRHGSTDQLKRVTLDIHAEGSNTVVVEASQHDSSWNWGRDNVVVTELEIKVPRRTNLDVNVFKAPLTVENVEGSFKVHGFSSRVRLENVKGPIQAKTFSGPVEIRAKAWEDAQAIDIDTFSGNVELHVPESAKGHVTFNSFSGHLHSDVPLTVSDMSRRSTSGDLGGGDSRSHVKFKTFSGSVKIDR